MPVIEARATGKVKFESLYDTVAMVVPAMGVGYQPPMQSPHTFGGYSPTNGSAPMGPGPGGHAERSFRPGTMYGGPGAEAGFKSVHPDEKYEGNEGERSETDDPNTPPHVNVDMQRYPYVMTARWSFIPDSDVDRTGNVVGMERRALTSEILSEVYNRMGATVMANEHTIVSLITTEETAFYRRVAVRVFPGGGDAASSVSTFIGELHINL